MIKRMMLEHYKGIDIVYGVRKARSTDTAFKRMSAEGYYHLLSKMGVNIAKIYMKAKKTSSLHSGQSYCVK